MPTDGGHSVATVTRRSNNNSNGQQQQQPQARSSASGTGSKAAPSASSRKRNLWRSALCVATSLSLGWMYNMSAWIGEDHSEYYRYNPSLIQQNRKKRDRLQRNPGSLLDVSNLKEDLARKPSGAAVAGNGQNTEKRRRPGPNVDDEREERKNKAGVDANKKVKRHLPGKSVVTAADRKREREMKEPLLVKSMLAKKIAMNKEKISKWVKQYPVCEGKEFLLRVIFSADDNRLRQTYEKDAEGLCSRLPSKSEVDEIWGSEAIVYGMETCRAYRDLLKPENNGGKAIFPKPRVSGLYHTGTNALSRSLDTNLDRLSPKVFGFSPHEVPWGKHLPPAVHRLNHTYPDDNKEDRFRVLPVVLIRDPFWWMQSMCKTRYDAKWEKPLDNRCPNLIQFPQNKTTYKVSAKTHQTHYKKTDNYTSLADMWSTWNTQYLEADYPRLIIRFEDTIYRLEDVVEKVRECVGLNKTGEPFRYQISSAKPHGAPTDYVKGLRKFVSTTGRHRGMNEYDRQYAREVLNPELLRIFNYKQAPLEVIESDLKGPFSGWVPKKNKLRPVTTADEGKKGIRNIESLKDMLAQRRESKKLVTKRLSDEKRTKKKQTKRKLS